MWDPAADPAMGGDVSGHNGETQNVLGSLTVLYQGQFLSFDN